MVPHQLKRNLKKTKQKPVCLTLGLVKNGES